jgi:serine protease Do
MSRCIVLRGGKEVSKTVKLGRLEDGEKVASNTRKTDGDAPANGDAAAKAAGLELGNLSPDLRRRYQIKDGVEGVVVLRVTPGSKAADRFVQPGDTIVEIQRTPVKSVADVTKRLGELKKDGRSNALFYIANAQGDLRYVTLPVE